MKQLLNTIYVTSPDSFIHRDGTNLVVEVEGITKGRVPIHNIQQVVTFGYAGASPQAMYLCAENNVSLTFMSPTGRFLATCNGSVKGNVLLRRSQYRIADDAMQSLNIASSMIVGKMINCRTVLKKGLYNHKSKIDSVMLEEIISKISESIDSAKEADSAGSLRGIEGDAAKAYFRGINLLILKEHDYFYMEERSRRPPRDRFNALLSFLYSLLTNDVKSSLEAVGMDPFVGFLHTDRPGRPSLALDVMEEMRPIVDRLVLRLINLGMIRPDDFIEEEGGAFHMTDDARALVINEWQESKKIECFHPFLGEKIPIGLVPYAQSMLLSKCIRKDLDGYPPYIIKQAIS